MDSKKLDAKWQMKWNKSKSFEANIDKKKNKFFTSIIIPYVNGNIHIGHSFTYTRIDAYARFKRMQGYNTLLAEAFHATGEPILGSIERLKKKDRGQIETFKMYGATDKDLKDFVKKGPEFVARFWMEKIIESSKLMGFSVDWRRKFVTAIDPAFNRFIEWQYNTLRKKGYVIQGTHPVVWCSHDQSPTGDHDRLKGEGESPTQFVLLKFKLDSGEVLPCATLRPETIYGVTNLWINPNAHYVRIRIKNEIWFVSKSAAQKLEDQLKNVEYLGDVAGRDLIGENVSNPVTGQKILILPGEFVDEQTATGIVMSVPAHAPYDYVALKELKNNEKEMGKYKLDPSSIKNIKSISVVKIEGFENAGVEISEKMGISSTKESEKLEEATSIVYKKEFHTGVLRDIAEGYVGKKIGEVKQVLIDDFVKRNLADKMWETTNPVICRCTTRCHIKILENQWFLKFSDIDWKNKVKHAISQMKFYPEEARLQFMATVDWLEDKACARKGGLGTKMPWDKEWIIETLSDSVIYMAYYTIADVINGEKIPAHKLTDEVFDYIFLGKGDPTELGKKVDLNKVLIQKMHEEFEYFYPVDMRNSAKELVPNHLTYYIFHHVAIWENPKYWPKSIGVNGYVTVQGEKMAKSKGNIIPLKELLKKYGADLVRVNIGTANENIDDADWREDSLKTFETRLDYLDYLVQNCKKAKRKSTNDLDKYLDGVVQNCIKGTTENYEVMKFRSGMQFAIFQLLNEIKYYIERNGNIKNCNQKVLKNAISNSIKLIAPFTPHVSEEFWKKIGVKGILSAGGWPEFNEKSIDRNVLDLENLFKKTQEDMTQVLKLAGKMKNAYLYMTTDKEFNHFKQSVEYLKKRFDFKKLEVYKVSDKNKYDPQNKSSRAKYGKPAIYLE
ncbi:MAG: leucine--tRNA ligase [Candidatus Aenigmarchaeota archaeon]|nr:leucine--tRNA ligase [Candidatus Aenigmarchaeota archaeon]